jgi:RNA polymerase sigma factor (sigma-70 family)
MRETPNARSAVEAVWRREAGRLIAGLARLTGDLGLAEELAQDALVAALEHWPETGVPPNPGGWLMTTAKRRAIDLYRHRDVSERKLHLIADDRQPPSPADLAAEAADDHVGDDLLRLIFTACHPALAMESRVALVLKCLAGLSTAEIARAFLVSEPTVAQRIVRAKKTLAAQQVPFELPTADDVAARRTAVLEVIYLIFNEGYAATAGENWMRPELCREAMRLGRVLVGLLPADAEVGGLLALMELQASRLPSRTDADGNAVLLADQDRSRWDRLLIRRGLAELDRVRRLAAPAGPYLVQAEIAACHAKAASVADTRWDEIAAWYAILGHLWPSPVVELNRAIAVGMADGPAAGLALLDELADSRDLTSYPQLPAARADMLARLGRLAEARQEYERAAALSKNDRERQLFTRRALA